MEARVHVRDVYLDFRELPGDSFDVFRSTRDIGEFDYVVTTSQGFYLDEAVNLAQSETTYFYKIRYFDGGEKETKVFTYPLGQQDNIARKIIQEYGVQLRIMKNPPLYLLARRHEGASHCPECWNPVTRKVRFADCERCGGTGQSAAYHAPVAIRVSRDLSAYSAMMMPEDVDKVKMSPISGWAAAVPRLMVDDIFVDTQGQRYRLMNVEHRMKGQSIIRQVFNAVPLEKGHPAYLVPVPEVNL